MSQHVSTCLNMSQRISTCLNISQHVSTCLNMSQYVTWMSLVSHTQRHRKLYLLDCPGIVPPSPSDFEADCAKAWDHGTTMGRMSWLDTSCRNVTKLEIPISKRHSKDIQNVQKSKLCNFTHMEHMGLRLWAVLFTVSCSGCFGLWMGVKQANKLLPRRTIILKTCFKEKLTLSKIEKD